MLHFKCINMTSLLVGVWLVGVLLRVYVSLTYAMPHADEVYQSIEVKARRGGSCAATSLPTPNLTHATTTLQIAHLLVHGVAPNIPPEFQAPGGSQLHLLLL